MKPFFLFTLYHLPLVLFCQETTPEPWTFECGASSTNFFSTVASINLRYISPPFKFSNEDLTEEEEEKKSKDFRFMLEVLYRPSLLVLGAAVKMQYCVIKRKGISLEAYMGPKFFFKPGPDFIEILHLKGGKNMWYYNLGIILQAHLKVVSPFFDIGTDGIVTIGAEFDFHGIYKNPKRRYKLRKREIQTEA